MKPHMKAARAVSTFCDEHLNEKSSCYKALSGALKNDYGLTAVMTEKFIRHNLNSVKTLLKTKTFQNRVRNGSLKGHKIIVTSSNVPEPLLYAFLSAVLTQSHTFIKFSAHTKRFSGYLSRYFMKNYRDLIQNIQTDFRYQSIGKFSGNVSEAVLFGDDKTIKYIRSEMADDICVTENGNRISFGVMNFKNAGKSALKKQAALAAQDIWDYDQRGCCSPLVYFVKGDAEGFAADLHAALSDRVQKFGQAFRAEAACFERRVIADRLSVSDRSEIKSIHGDIRSNDPIIYISAAQLKQISGGYLIAGVIPYKDEEDLLRMTTGLKEAVQAFSYFGYPAQSEFLNKMRRLLNAGYVCATGKLQSPPAGWNFSITGL